MKFIAVSLTMLVLILVFCIFTSVRVMEAVDVTAELLEGAVTAENQAQTDRALAFVRSATETWKHHEVFFGTVLRHDEIDNVLSEFARLESYAITRDREEFLANCASLLAQLEHIREMELPTFQNIM